MQIAGGETPRNLAVLIEDGFSCEGRLKVGIEKA
jgi:hypothetical protein